MHSDLSDTSYLAIRLENELWHMLM